MLEAFREPGLEFPRTERGQHVAVTDHQLRRPECPDQVLPEPTIRQRTVDPRLPSDGRIDHAEKGGRSQHQIDSPHPAACGESGDVAHDATAQRHHETSTIDAGGEQVIPDSFDGLHGLRRFEGFESPSSQSTLLPERRLEHSTMTVRHDPFRTGIDGHIDPFLRSEPGFGNEKFVRPTEEASTDQDRRPGLLELKFVTVHENLVSGHLWVEQPLDRTDSRSGTPRLQRIGSSDLIGSDRI